MADDIRTANERELVVFDLRGCTYGLEIGEVREIIRMREITRLPESPEAVKGVINLGDEIVPVVDLSPNQSHAVTAQSDSRRIMVVDTGSQCVGITVDAVTEVCRVPEAAIESLPTPATGAPDCVSGSVRANGRKITLLDVNRAVFFDEGTDSSDAVGPAA